MTRATSPRKTVKGPAHRGQGVLPVDDRQSAARLADLLVKQGGQSARLRIAVENGESVDLPPLLAEMLQMAADLVAGGAPVTVMASDTQLTTQEAADLLNVSRQYLVRLIDRGELAATKVGAHRRVRAEDLAAYRRRRDQTRRQGLGALVSDAQLAGDYDQPLTFGPARQG